MLNQIFKINKNLNAFFVDFPQILLGNRVTNVNARMHDGTTPLITAVRLSIEGMGEELISAGADINAADEHGLFL